MYTDHYMTNWMEIYRRYPGKWVAIDAEDEETVVAADSDARRAYAEGERSGKRTILHRVPENVIDLVGYEISL